MILSSMYIGLHVQYPLFLSDFTETWIFLTDFWQIPNIKFHENPPSGNWVVPWGCTDRQIDMTKLIITFHSFVNVPSNTVLTEKTGTNYHCALQQISEKWMSVKQMMGVLENESSVTSITYIHT